MVDNVSWRAEWFTSANAEYTLASARLNAHTSAPPIVADAVGDRAVVLA